MDKIANMLGALSVVLADGMREAIDEALDVTGETAAAIVTLGANPGLTVGKLARALGLSHSGAVRLADRLAHERLLERVPGKDSREVTLRLTRDGEQARITALRQRERVLHAAMAHLSHRDIENLGLCLDKMLRGLLTKAGADYRFCRLCDEDSCVPASCPVEERSKELFG